MSLTSSSHWHHGLRVIRPFETEAFDSRQSRDDNKGLVGIAGSVVSFEFKTRRTGTTEQTLRPRKAELLTDTRVVRAAVGRPRRG